MNLQIGAKVFLENGHGKYLFLQRAEPLPSGEGIVWDIPGGRVEPGENVTTALRREVRAECGLEIVGPRLLVVAQEILLPQSNILRLTYLARASGAVTLGVEHTDYAWLDLEAAETQLMFDSQLAKVVHGLVAGVSFVEFPDQIAA